MKTLVGILLLTLAIAGALVEWYFPPVSKTYESQGFGGSWDTATHHARRGIDSGFATVSKLEIDGKILLIELSLVAGAVLVGFSAWRRDRGMDSSATASHMAARAALVLHASVWTLPLFQAGADILSFVAIPLIAVLLLPNLLSAAFVAGFDPFASPPWPCSPPRSTGRSYLLFHLIVALGWSLIFGISLCGMDFNNPMGGAVLGVLALWFSVLSAALKKRTLRPRPNP